MADTSWQTMAFSGGVILVLGILIKSFSMFGLGTGFLISAIWKLNHPPKEKVIDWQKQRERIESGIFPQKDKSHFHLDGEENPLLYSEILKKEVKNCCFQSARLNDKYCVCGRALEYPIEANK